MARAEGGSEKWGKRRISGKKHLYLGVIEQINKTQQYHSEERALKTLRVVLQPTVIFLSCLIIY